MVVRKLVFTMLFLSALSNNVNAMINEWVAEIQSCIESVKKGKNFDVAYNVVLLRERSQNHEIQYWVKELKQVLGNDKPINTQVQKEPKFIVEQRNEINTYFWYVLQGKLLDVAEQIASTRIISQNPCIKIAALKLFGALVDQGVAFNAAKKAVNRCLSHDDAEVILAAKGLNALLLKKS